jgi:lipid A disaccharide synthetase
MEMPVCGRTGQRNSPLLPGFRRKEVRHGTHVCSTALSELAVILPTRQSLHPHSPQLRRQAQLRSAERANLVAFLDRNFAEKLTAVGLVNQNAVLEVYAAESGTWTLVVTDVHGISCILLSGDSWETMPALPGLAT